MRDKIAGALARAPLVVAVVNRADPTAKIPDWEQTLCAGAVCMNLVVTANAMGYGANWLTGWAAMDADARAVLGVGSEESLAGLIHICTPPERPAARPTPDLHPNLSPIPEPPPPPPP